MVIDVVERYFEATPISKSTGKRSLDSNKTENMVYVEDAEGSTKKPMKFAFVWIEKDN
jgi:hypothetical protein